MPLNSLADALTGLQANQSYMNVVGNNIANINTTGYKTQDIHFADLLNATLVNDSTATAGGLEGTNAVQVGLGVGSGAINILNTQGTEQSTGRLSDMAIQGGGYFVLGNGTSQHFYTRDGSFNLSPDGTLEAGAIGMTVQGWVADPATGVLSTTTPLSPIKLPLSSVNVSPTTAVTMSGNLDSTQATYKAAVTGATPTPASGGTYTTAITVYDSQGAPHQLSLLLTKNATTNKWDYTFGPPAPTTGTADVSVATAGSTGSLTFDSSGALPATPPTTATLALTFGNGAKADSVTVDFSQVSQVASASQVNVSNVDGSAAGTLSTFSVGKNGVVTAIYSNGTNKQVGQIALADFRNPDDLLRQGSNLYTEGVNSGKPQVGAAGTGTLGPIATGQLEGSNVDLAAQFGQMIQAQQGFNANTKVITTTNNMLQAVISIVP